MSANIRPAGVFDTSYEQDIALNRTRTDKLLSYGSFAVLLIFPLLTLASPLGVNLFSEAWIGIINRIAIAAIAVQGLNLLVGYTGQISLGHAAFMAVGAYSGAILARELGFSFWAALPGAALITGVVGLIFGLPSLRVKGFYLAMATLAAQFIIPWVLRYPLESLTNGTNPLLAPFPVIGPFAEYDSRTAEGSGDLSITIDGGDTILSDLMSVEMVETGATIPTMKILGTDGKEIVAGEITIFRDESGVITRLEYLASKTGSYTIQAMGGEGPHTLRVGVRKVLSFASDFAIYYIIVPLSVLLMLLARNIIRTRVGRAFISVRDNDLAAELLGINVFAYKLRAFFLSAVYAGIAGALFAFETNSLSLLAFQLDRSIELLAMLVIGGAGFPQGALFGASFFTLVNQFVIPQIRPFLSDTLPRLLPFVDAVNIQATINPFTFGLILAVFLILEPRGLAYRWEILKIAWKIRPYSQT